MSYYLPPGATPPPGGIPSDTPNTAPGLYGPQPAVKKKMGNEPPTGPPGPPVAPGGPPPPGMPPGGRPRPGRPGGQQGQSQGYQQFTQYAQGIQANPTGYEADVLGGKYLGVDSNPYVQGYANALSRDFQGNLKRGLSEVSSPFLSGATLGQSGIHADVRGRYFSEGQQDLGDTLAKNYFDTYNQERGRQNEVSGQVSGRTNQLVGASGSAYGADVDAKARVQTAKIAASTALKQAQMAQALGYDELAAHSMLEYERLNQEAYFAEQQLNLGYAGLAGSIGRDFSDSTSSTQGPGMSSTEGILQGILGGGLSGIGAGQSFGGG